MQIDPLWLRSVFPDLQHLSELSRGGQKVVYSAVHPQDGEVVLKIIHPNQDVESIQREILAVRTINWRRVPQILQIGQITTPLGPSFWFREQRVPGETLRTRLQRGALVQNELLQLGRNVLEALSRAEEASIVHRDVKPDNIICHPSGDFWLLDFGIARHLTLDSLTATSLPFGKFTPGYAPPEQFRNVKGGIDARADLFAAGVTLFESATGSNPFSAGTSDPFEKMKRVENTVLPPLNLNFPAASDFSDLVQAMTQKRKDLRPSTVKEALVWMQEIYDKATP